MPWRKTCKSQTLYYLTFWFLLCTETISDTVKAFREWQMKQYCVKSLIVNALEICDLDLLSGWREIHCLPFPRSSKIWAHQNFNSSCSHIDLSCVCLYDAIWPLGCAACLDNHYHIISVTYHVIYHIISCHIISYIISYHHIISYHIISYHIISYHIISYHITISRMLRPYYSNCIYIECRAWSTERLSTA